GRCFPVTRRMRTNRRRRFSSLRRPVDVVVVLLREVCWQVGHATGVLQKEGERRFPRFRGRGFLFKGQLHARPVRNGRWLIQNDRALNDCPVKRHLLPPLLGRSESHYSHYTRRMA